MYDSINYILTGFKAPFETTERNNMYMYKLELDFRAVKLLLQKVYFN